MNTSFTQIPNELLDCLVSSRLRPAEKSILLLVIRQTYGYHKKSDRISLTQFEKKTRLARSSVNHSLTLLVRCGLLVKEKGNGKTPNSWSICLDDVNEALVRYTELVGRAVVVRTEHTKENIQNKDIRVSRETLKKSSVTRTDGVQSVPDVKQSSLPLPNNLPLSDLAIANTALKYKFPTDILYRALIETDKQFGNDNLKAPEPLAAFVGIAKKFIKDGISNYLSEDEEIYQSVKQGKKFSETWFADWFVNDTEGLI